MCCGTAEARMDFVSIWKAASIILTGAFGVLGLLTDFKDKFLVFTDHLI